MFIHTVFTLACAKKPLFIDETAVPHLPECSILLNLTFQLVGNSSEYHSIAGYQQI